MTEIELDLTDDELEAVRGRMNDFPGKVRNGLVVMSFQQAQRVSAYLEKVYLQETSTGKPANNLEAIHQEELDLIANVCGLIQARLAKERNSNPS